MTLYIYKGFDKAFLEQLSCDPLVGGDISSKIDILSFSKKTRKTLEKELLAKYGSPTPEALVESAMGHVKLLEACDFNDIVISIKSSDVHTMIDAYRLAAETCNYPLHLGVTEAGTAHRRCPGSGSPWPWSCSEETGAFPS